MPDGARAQRSTNRLTSATPVVVTVVTVRDSRRASPAPSTAPGAPYFKAMTSAAAPPSASIPTAATIATRVATAPASGPPTTTARATGRRWTSVSAPPHQPRGAVLSSTVRATPHPAPSRRARRAHGRGPMGRDLLGYVRDGGDRAESLQRGRQLPLVPCTVRGDPAGDDLATLGHEGPEALDVAIVDGQHLVD